MDFFFLCAQLEPWLAICLEYYFPINFHFCLDFNDEFAFWKTLWYYAPRFPLAQYMHLGNWAVKNN